MSKIPFMPDIRELPLSASEIEDRLTNFLIALRKRLGKITATDLATDSVGEAESLSSNNDVELTIEDHFKIRRRTKRLAAKREAVSCLAHLKSNDRKRLQLAEAGVSLNGPATVQEVDELASQLMNEMPWMQPVIKPIWQDARQHLARGGYGLWHRPLIVVGPPGIGKSHFARRLAELSRLPTLKIDVGGGSAGFAVAGVQRGWGTACPGRPVEMILSHGVGNPIVVVDEICKAGVCYSETGASTSIVTSLLGLLEPVSARSWECPYFNVNFDMSRICWIMTANDVTTIPLPLRSRCRVIELGGLPQDDLLNVVGYEAAKRGLDQMDVHVVRRLITSYPKGHPALNLRVVTRYLDDLETLAQAPVLH